MWLAAKSAAEQHEEFFLSFTADSGILHKIFSINEYKDLFNINNVELAWASDHPDVKIKNHGLGQYGAEPHYSTLQFWQLCAFKS